MKAILFFAALSLVVLMTSARPQEAEAGGSGEDAPKPAGGHAAVCGTLVYTIVD